MAQDLRMTISPRQQHYAVTCAEDAQINRSKWRTDMAFDKTYVLSSSNNLWKDVVAGSNARVFAGGGNDSIYGRDGDDELNGESGNDKLYGESGWTPSRVAWATTTCPAEPRTTNSMATKVMTPYLVTRATMC